MKNKNTAWVKGEYFYPSCGSVCRVLRRNAMSRLAFWHAFGPYVGETPEQIIERKRNEIYKNDWTLWSFRKMRPQSLVLWINEINRENPDQVLVLCSAGRNNIDPQPNNNANANPQPTPANGYKEYTDNGWPEDWTKIPKTINVTYPWGNNREATAFKVSKILLPSEDGYMFDWFEPIMWKVSLRFKWFRIADNTWSPNRPNNQCRNYLIQSSNDDNGFVLGPIRAVLELRSPYVVQIKRDE